jgi:bifunctional aspartokinase / homoserine dehydrogenase 1
MKVLKFGGTSVANAENISKVISIVSEQLQQQELLVVVSALGGVTDALLLCGTLAANGDETYKENIIKIEQRHFETVKGLVPVQQQSTWLSLVKKNCNEIEELCNGLFAIGEFTERSKDKLLSYGELLSSQIIAAAFNAKQINAVFKDARALIKTNSNFSNATVNVAVTEKNIETFLKETTAKLYVLPGFIASDAKGVTTTLGRGGSDYTAAILAAAVNASSLEIWTDVSGMMTADPRWVPNARIINAISYQEAMELSHFGAKVIYPPTIQPVMSKHIPVWIKNTFQSAAAGTLIEAVNNTDNGFVTGISAIHKIALLSLEGSGMVGIPGFSKRLFEALAKEKINVILITQSSSEHSICVAVNQADAHASRQAVDDAFSFEIKAGSIEPLRVEEEVAVIALVGDKMKSQPGVSGRMFGTLGRNGVNVRAIAQGSSEKNISAVVSTADVYKAINVLHEEFFEEVYKELNLFIAGAGNVGSKLIEQLAQQQQFLLKHLKVYVKVVGLANSKKVLFNENGIDLHNWKQHLQAAPLHPLHDFVNMVREKNLRNSVFVDVTASEQVAGVYEQVLEKSVSVVACNKIAAASPYENYNHLKQLARKYNTFYLFETNVGAALPVIGTLNDLMKTGDSIKTINAVLSGTLNFVFNNYDGTKPFADIVKQAQDEGYTEPDPRLDLGGVDVMRKIMILAREAGNHLEMSDITNNSFLPASCMQGSVDDFYNEMHRHENHFKNLYDEAARAGCKLKFVAEWKQGKANVGLQHISPGSDLFHLYGKDNIVLFYTNRYAQQPLVIKGAGAGADVTAAGVFADIMRVAI